MVRPRAVVFALALLATGAFVAFGPGTVRVATAAGCVPPSSQPFASWGDANWYFLAPGGNFEASTTGWAFAGGAGVVSGNESYDVGGTGARSASLPTTSASVTTPMMCVNADSPSFRLFLKNNGNLGMIDGQLAVYLNFTGADGRPQQVKIAALKVNSTAWTLSPSIKFIQYLSTPLQTGTAQVSFTLRPNDTHGNWQIDDFFVDPYCSR